MSASTPAGRRKARVGRVERHGVRSLARAPVGQGDSRRVCHAPAVHWLFVYGTLMPGRLRWPQVADVVAERRPAAVAGTLYDTGHGYPALVLAAPGGSRAGCWAMARRPSPPRSWPLLDEVEGPSYRQAPVTAADGTRGRHLRVGRARWPASCRWPAAGTARTSDEPGRPPAVDRAGCCWAVGAALVWWWPPVVFRRPPGTARCGRPGRPLRRLAVGRVGRPVRRRPCGARPRPRSSSGRSRASPPATPCDTMQSPTWPTPPPAPTWR